MTQSDLPDTLREVVRGRARGRCEYCLTSEQLSGIQCQIDHILPRSRGGETTAENLCLACLACNGHKHAKTRAVDPDTRTEVRLFNPRHHDWHEHFTWNLDGTQILGLTASGRATIGALRMNAPLIVGARSLWAAMGAHPPAE